MLAHPKFALPLLIFVSGFCGTAQAAPISVQSLLDRHTCTACHAQDHKVVGPSFNDITQKYPGKTDYLMGKIKLGSTGIWGPAAMPPQSAPEADIRSIADWLASGMK